MAERLSVRGDGFYCGDVKVDVSEKKKDGFVPLGKVLGRFFSHSESRFSRLAAEKARGADAFLLVPSRCGDKYSVAAQYYNFDRR